MAASWVPSPATVDFGTAMAAVEELERLLRPAAGGQPDGQEGGQEGEQAGEAGFGVDLSTLTRFDSSALSVLLELRRRFGGARAPFAAIHPPQALLALARVYGVADLLFPAPAAARP